MTSSEFQKHIADGSLVPKKGNRARFGAKSATIGHITEQMPEKPTKSLKSLKKPVSKKIKKARQLAQMEMWLSAIGIKFVIELKFSSTRMFRFDIAIPERKIAIEYEGIVSSKSRHTTKTGYTRDTEKYNLAAIEGWRVLRYTALNYKNVIKDISLLLKDN